MKMKTLKLSVLACAALVTGFVSCEKKDTPNPIPTISSFAPTSAFAEDTVTISGTNFTGVTGVSFGSSAAASFIISNATTIKAVVGAGATGDVKVLTTAGSATLPGFTLKVSAPGITKTDSISAAFSPAGKFTYFSFKNDAVVAETDSATAKWDFAFKYVNIIVNSHASGPGNAAVIVQPGIYGSYTTAPTTGYAYDTTKTQTAINAKDRDPNAWYLYNPTVHALTPKAGQFFVFRTSDNHYVKMEILSVTTDVPFTNPVPPTTIWYKFRYTYQADGSRNF